MCAGAASWWNSRCALDGRSNPVIALNMITLIAPRNMSCLAWVIYFPVLLPGLGFLMRLGAVEGCILFLISLCKLLHSQPSRVKVTEGESAYVAAGKCSAQRSLGTSTLRRHAYTVREGSRGSRRRCFWKIIQHTHKRRLFQIIIDGSGQEKHCSVTRFPAYNK